MKPPLNFREADEAVVDCMASYQWKQPFHRRRNKDGFLNRSNAHFVNI